ncbi:hypothetical protein Pan216_15340 [Planctomycetes bacterium Pan216]|uniref:Uncharacterized protein n=1 Tax=Kolteria novifilia TaxID=2527975 RepID=A0A518B145_9BACT|nr:hypothetical protein Pan216_15340 [Planctomycetes bacterium Pan216]
MTPLFASLNMHWYLPPLVIAVSLVYSATRYEDWGLIWRHAIRWALYILAFLGSAYLVLFLISIEIPFFWLVLVVLGLAFVFYRTGSARG